MVHAHQCQRCQLDSLKLTLLTRLILAARTVSTTSPANKSDPLWEMLAEASCDIVGDDSTDEFGLGLGEQKLSMVKIKMKRKGRVGVR